MTERTYTEAEVKAVAQEAALAALTKFAAVNPVPATVSIREAAKMLNVSPRTVDRLKLPRVSAGRIPYSAIVELLAAK